MRRVRTSGKGHWQLGTYNGRGSVDWFPKIQWGKNWTTHLLAFMHDNDAIILQHHTGQKHSPFVSSVQRENSYKTQTLKTRERCHHVLVPWRINNLEWMELFEHKSHPLGRS